MLLLDSFSLITPEPGLVIWTVIIFVILWLILGKFAFKPIAEALKNREQTIEDALKAAEKARAEMENLTAQNEQIIREAKEERVKIIAEAKQVAEKLKAEMVDKAAKEADEKLQQALREIDNQKKAALVEVKNYVGLMALDIAEKVIKKELKSDASQVEFVEKLAKEANLN
jgi:F-type H+-transporting ATPase subunit b